MKKLNITTVAATIAEAVAELEHVERIACDHDKQVGLHAFLKLRDAAKMYKNAQDEIGGLLLEYADRKGLNEIRSGDTVVKVIRGKEKAGLFDEARFKAEHPDIYAEYCTAVKPASKPYLR